MSNELSPKHRRAYGAIDDQGQGYLLLEPVNGSRPERCAIHLGPGAGLAQAEHLAADFNSGRADLLRIRPDQLRTGDQIPRLHKAPD